MKHQNRAFQLSLLIHAVIVTAIFGTNALLHGPNRRIIMNFDLARPNDKPAGILTSAFNIQNPAFADFICTPMCDPFRSALVNYGAG